MKIVAVEAFPVRAALPEGQTYWGAKTWSSDRGMRVSTYPNEARRRYIYSQTIDTVIVRIETADGVVGWGESKAPVGATITAALVDELLAPLVMNSRLDEIAITWERMYAAMRVRGHDSGFWLEALSGIDIALWDAWGKTLQQPVASLLGGAFRTDVPVYASGIPAAPGAEGRDGVRLQAEALLERGFRSVKVAVGVDPQTDLDAVRIVREVLGSEGRVFADAAGQYDIAQAMALASRLADYDVGFFEMPMAPENIDGYRRLAEKSTIPLALDSISGRFRALEFLRVGGLHIVQPDVCRAGGISEVMRIAALADAFGALATPHVSIGSAIHFAASLQCAAAIPNFDIMEHWIGNNPLAEAIAPDIDTPVNGIRTLHARPGLGISVDEDAVRRLSAG
ncbi:mandelate racemase/muconate lactonizing enzyme family protein [Diaminobutyricibacter sp. McL0618]|uniref:mandelate racemase/muconate lactonizing enzyme family protein n=1 Tax=Leifsonia sp. McL0618 TaxID=3415677 RepID=UPI003CEAC983